MAIRGTGFCTYGEVGMADSLENLTTEELRGRLADQGISEARYMTRTGLLCYLRDEPIPELEQIMAVLQEQEAGTSVADLCRKQGISEPMFYAWKEKFSKLSIADAERLKKLAQEAHDRRPLVFIGKQTIRLLRYISNLIGKVFACLFSMVLYSQYLFRYDFSILNRVQLRRSTTRSEKRNFRQTLPLEHLHFGFQFL